MLGLSVLAPKNYGGTGGWERTFGEKKNLLISRIVYM